MTSTTTGPGLDLATAQDRADTARAAADDIRAQVAAGAGDVTPDQLAAAESAERFALAQLDAARQRDQERRDREAADQLVRDREAVQRDYAELGGPEPDHLVQLREQAVDAVTTYLAAYRARSDHRAAVHDRARELGFRLTSAGHSGSPLPQLGRQIVHAAREHLRLEWIRPNLDNLNSRVWE